MRQVRLVFDVNGLFVANVVKSSWIRASGYPSFHGGRW
jgi:hypothetical protein